MGILKKAGLMLGILMMFGFGQISMANAEISVTELTTEEGNKIEIGVPRINYDAATPFKRLGSNNLNINQQQTTKEENKIKQSIKVNPSTIDTTIEIPFEFENGEYLVLYENQELKGGVGNIYNEDGKSIGVFSSKIVESQEKALLNTEIKDKDSLELQVKSNNLSEPIEIEFSVAATYYSTYFSDFSWITRSGVKSLSLTHTGYIHDALDPGMLATRKVDAWDKLYAVHSGSSNWNNTAGMQDQFYCHVDFAGFKNPWNLEPSRPNVSYAATVAAACNPE